MNRMSEAAQQEKTRANSKLAMLLATIAAAMYLFVWIKDWS